MSIIIRLQNLPWNANAADIRQFFQNLTIPDGGVHIVGGENGDVFIAFGSDEDARQAMLLDGGKIKEAKIKLLLSSRTEMQKVIELARQQALTLQNLMQSMAAASTFGASSLSLLPTVLSGMSSVLPNLSSLPSVGAASVAIPAPPTSSELKELKTTAHTESKIGSKSYAGKSSSTKADAKTRSSSRSRSGSMTKSRSRSHSRSRSRSRDGRYRDKYRYGGSGSGGRSKDRKWRRDRSRSRDRYKRRSRSKDRDVYKSRDKRRTYDKRDKSPTKDESKKNSDGKSKTTNVSDEKQLKKELTLLKVSPVPVYDSKASNANEQRPVSDNVSTIVAQILAKSKTASGSEKDKSSADGDATKLASASESTKTEEELQKRWMGEVPMPPMISPWTVPQTSNEKCPAEKEPDKPTEAASNENKVQGEASALVVPPFGMFSAQFPYGAGFPPPPASMYPFVGYPTPATVDKTTAMTTAGVTVPPMQIPQFFNPYQRAHVAQPNFTNEMTNQPSKMSHSRDTDDHGPSQKLPRLQNDDDAKTDSNSYDYDVYDYSTSDSGTKRYSYFNGERGEVSRNYYNDCNFRKRDDDRFNSYDSSSYSYSASRHNSYDGGWTNRRPYPRRNFDETDPELEDRAQSGYEFKKNSSLALAYPGSVCAQVENLPQDAVVDDVKRFFTPLPLYESSIKFQLDDKENDAKNAFVKFLNLSHKLQAIKYSGKILRGRRVVVSEMDTVVWEAAEDHVIASVEQHCLKISFIPKRAKKQNVLDAFPNAPDDLILMKDKNKDSLVAYLKFGDNAMVKNALIDRNKILIGGGRVKLEPISEEDFLVARADYQTSDDVLDDDSAVVEEYEPQCEETKSNCIMIKNLPSPVSELDIVNFFADINVIPSHIHLLFDTNYKRTGDCFCEFENETNAAEAIAKKNQTKMKYRTVTVITIPREEVLRVVGNQLPEENYSNAHYNNLPPIQKPYPPRFGPPGYNGHGPRPFPPRGPPVSGRQPSGPPENFGKPGCVVSLENVPYKSEVDDILQFFSDFDVQRENVIRRFNEKGLPTGDARVSLQSPSEAEKAVEQLDGKIIRGRTICVRLVS